MDRLSAVAWKIVDVADMRVIAARDLRAVNDNDEESFDALAHDMVAILMRDGRSLLAG